MASPNNASPNHRRTPRRSRRARRDPSVRDRIRVLPVRPVRVGSRLPLTAAALVVVAAVTGCGARGGGPASATGDGMPAAATQGAARPVTGLDAPAPQQPARLPGLGPKTLAQIPGDARQVVLVTGQGKNANRSEVVLYQRTDAGWRPGATWPAHNALKGWTDDHHVGDLRSPIGVFTLSDAGGRLPDPGSKLPYTRSRGFTVGGDGFNGESLAGAFDYVVAIDYNHKKGTSPLDWTRPLGADRGGGIWLHVDHGGPTHGCVSLDKAHMKELLRTLDPALHPVVVMGDAGSLSS
ncbi:L,D-transpeptidase family protein [Streptomyces sp. NPDC047017]|uniref:L,D-transpeptidase family protein n=1 Tax=Streptomyces sp. NPDC047017 TaxID=3155024 RepID=UPI00340EEEF0